jgi:hypothetical protein
VHWQTHQNRPEKGRKKADLFNGGGVNAKLIVGEDTSESRGSKESDGKECGEHFLRLRAGSERWEVIREKEMGNRRKVYGLFGSQCRSHTVSTRHQLTFSDQ